MNTAAQTGEEKKAHLHATDGLAAAQFVARLCNGARFNGSDDPMLVDRQIIGDATDTAILRFAEALPNARELVDPGHAVDFEIPFNSRNKWMLTVVHAKSAPEERTMLVKGAPDRLFSACTSAISSNGTLVPFNAAHFLAVQDRWAGEGLRVLALCRHSLSGIKIDFDAKNTLEEQIVQDGFEDLTLVGLIGLRDPPRPDVKGAVEVIRTAHVKVFMVTGDYMATAIGIARKVSDMIVGCLSLSLTLRRPGRHHYE